MSQTAKLGTRATSVFTDDQYTHVQYHSTRVVSFNGSTLILRTGGWQTATTKLRMNQASHQFGLGFEVVQKDYAWFVNFRGRTIPFDGVTLLLKL